jgi:hypothetical protein
VVRARVLAGAVIALLATGGCTKILGIDYTYRGTGGGASTTVSSTSAGTGGKAPCGTLVWDGLSTCQTCMEASCCTDLEACDDGTPCGTLAACAHKCAFGDDACKKACIDADSASAKGAGLTAYNTLLGCFTDNCSVSDACAIPICDSTFTWNDRGCADCLGNDPTCCAAFTDCAKDPLCSACTQNPTGAGCDTSTLFQATLTCETMTCAEQCSFVICGSDIGYPMTSCNYCVSQATGGCCMQFDTCKMDKACYDCLSGVTVAGCDTNTVYAAYNSCVLSQCSVPCSGI